MNESLEEELVEVAMQIILHAGDARLKISEALGYAKKFAFDEAQSSMQTAEHAIHNAHRCQTNVIQSETRGVKYPHSLLFAHAQDTLMTINSELNLSKEMIEILCMIAQQIKKEDEQ